MDRTPLDRGELDQDRHSPCRHDLGRPPDVCYVVGDTPRDMEAGRYAGAVTVGVATGSYTVEQLNDAGADHVLRTFADDPFPGTERPDGG